VPGTHGTIVLKLWQAADPQGDLGEVAADQKAAMAVTVPGAISVKPASRTASKR
jgi:hypothetical protein